MTTQTHFTTEDFQLALRGGCPVNVVVRQAVRQRAEADRAVKLQLKAAKSDVTAIYFPRESMTKTSFTQRAITWIKSVVR